MSDITQLQREVEKLRGTVADLEKERFSIEEKIEEAEGGVAGAERRIQTKKTDWERELAEMTRELERKKGELQEKQKELGTVGSRLAEKRRELDTKSVELERANAEALRQAQDQGGKK